jgi:lipopolysaccharide/colanic/teichoic acid biosynthesis glycosyltransferase
VRFSEREDTVAATICTPIEPSSISRWSLGSGKRVVDLLTSLAGLVLASPIIAIIAALILVSSGRPILFRQWRLSRNGNRFQLLKFRTMVVGASAGGAGVTRIGDTRITPMGRWLRKWKLDELPQLLNVIRGEMTLVGPRPDLEEFWALASTRDQAVLALTPGITGAASLAFCDEERLLSGVAPQHLVSFYVEKLLPQKARLDLEYAQRATFSSDCVILLKTLLCLFVSCRASGLDRQ